MSLENVRADITRVDTEIIRLIAERQDLALKIAQIKIREGIPVHDEQRAADVLSSVSRQAVGQKIDPVAVRKVFEILIAMSEDRQRKCSGKKNLPEFEKY
jgi:chorismate mutase